LQEFTNWTIKTIRSDRLIGPWLEERKFEWLPLISNTLINIMEHQKAVLILTDKEFEWFESYILSNINKKSLNRPILPFYSFNGFNFNLEELKTDTDFKFIYDMLGIMFPQGYLFWYIGKSKSKRATIAKIAKQPLLWIMDEDLPDSFYLESNDESVDIRLLNMYRLFDKTINGVLFDEVNVEK
jgi:hypothetical protein